MNRFRKAIATGMSAALLASLFTVIAASTALATVTVTPAGTVPRGGTSATPASFLFTENAKDDLNAASNFDVYIWDSTGDCTVAPGVGVNITASTVHFVGPATISAPGSLGATVTLSDHSFNVKWTNFDDNNVETILIGGLNIKADTSPAAALGAIKACVYNDAGGNFADAFAAETVTASGHLSTAVGQNSTDFDIALDTGSCPFVDATTTGPLLKIAGGNPESFGTLTTTATLGGVVSGLQHVTVTLPVTGTTVNHLANDPVTQTVPNCNGSTLGSPGTVADSLAYVAPGGQTRLSPGENNQGPVFELNAYERTAGFLVVGATITFTISTPGITFSTAPRLDTDWGLIVVGTSTGTSNVYGIMSADRTSVSWTVDTKSATAGSEGSPTLNLEQIFYDVAASVATGTAVNVTLATSAGVVVPTSRSNAVVGRVISATSPAPVVYIGENNQLAGQITLVESGKAFFTDGLGSNNTFAVCIIRPTPGTNEQFSAAPWAKVTVGDLRLREGDVSSPDNVVLGKATTVAGFPFACYYWTVWTASTVASTIVISGDEAGTAGPRINVPSGNAIGPVTASIHTGNFADLIAGATLEVRTVFATRAFRNQVIVTAASQPTIAVGSTGSPAGDILIQETAQGQLKGPVIGGQTGERICVEIVPNQNWNSLFDAYMKGGLITADQPIVTASNGVLASAVVMSLQNCTGQDEFPGGFGSTLIESFSFTITQQSNTGNGLLRISQIRYATVNDAVTGAVQVNVFGSHLDNGVGGTLIDFHALISNAKIGSTVAGTNATRLGVTQTGAFTTSTKLPHRNGYVTYRIDFGIGAAHQLVAIWGATKHGNDWTAFTRITSRVANASGVVYYYIRQSSLTWKSYRGNWIGGGVWTPARQTHWIR